MSLKLMTFKISTLVSDGHAAITYILMAQMLEELQLSVRALGQDGGAERLHNLLDGHGLVRELILGRAVPYKSAECLGAMAESMASHHTRPKAPMPTGCKSVYLFHRQSSGVHSTAVRGGGGKAPAGNLEGRAKDLGTHKLRHDD